MKSILIPALALFAATPGIASAADAATQRFEHEGSVYVYTVTKAGNGRVISGVEEKSGKTFRLRVDDRRVRGNVGSRQVTFALRDVEAIEATPAIVASR